MSRRHSRLGTRRSPGRTLALHAGHAHRFAPERLEARQLMATIAWDGDAGDGNFTNPLNWAGDIMPGFEDDAVITPGAGPFIELRAGDTASLKSLTVDWPLAINGTLGVSDLTTIGDNFFDVGATGRLETNNLTLEASTGGVSNLGEWTIGGTSLIDRRIVSEGTLLVAQSATITLGIGLNAALQYGSIDVVGGELTIREGATVTGADPAVEQLRIGTVLNVDGAAAFSNLGLNADGASPADQVRINFGASLVSTITDSTVRLEYALVTGATDLVDTDVVIQGRAILYGQTTINGGSVENRGILVVRPPTAAPTQPNSLEINNAPITMTRAIGQATRLFGNITVTGSDISITNTARLGNGLTLRDVGITRLGSGFNRSWWTVVGSLTASDLVTSGHAILWVRDGATLTLEGGSNAIHNQLLAYSDGLINWTGGDLVIEIPSAASADVSAVRVLHASFTGPDAHALDITGPGRLLVGELTVTFDDPAGLLVVNGKLENQERVEITGGTLRYESGLIASGQISWRGRHGEWIVGPGATLDLEESFTTISTNLTIIDDGQAPFLASVTLNTGIITLMGEGQWPTGSATPITLRNYGQIRKTGEGLRTLTGSITNLVHGQIAVESGHLTIDSPLFINRGTVSLGSDDFMSPRAAFRVTGDYREGGHAALVVRGRADGDVDDLPRFGVEGTMSLAGEVRIILSTIAPFTQAFTWQLGFSGTRRIGQFASMSITLPGLEPELTYAPNRFSVLIPA